MNAETATPEDVAAIIGNDSWTHLHCTECSYGVPHALVVEVGEEPDYESSTAYLCLEHLQAALKLATGDGAREPL